MSGSVRVSLEDCTFGRRKIGGVEGQQIVKSRRISGPIGASDSNTRRGEGNAEAQAQTQRSLRTARNAVCFRELGRTLLAIAGRLSLHAR